MTGARPDANLTPFERRALDLMSAANETPMGKRLQRAWLDRVYPVVRSLVSRRTYVTGLDWIEGFRPERGTLVAANHRSFFDQWLLMLSLWPRRLKFFDKILFPVRANYFYEKSAGVAINWLLGGGSLYPPIFRDPSKQEFNRYSLDRIVEFLDDPRTLVGVHPEGTRNKGDDPYQLLKAKPGVGQMILQGRPTVIPAFVNGLSNDFIDTVKSNFRPGARRDNPIIVVFGETFDYRDLAAKPPRAALYLKTSVRLLDRIRELGEVERELRQRIVAGDVPDDDPGWLFNRSWD